jgi:hypothetical protein
LPSVEFVEEASELFVHRNNRFRRRAPIRE